jgi:hypothetical protein
MVAVIGGAHPASIALHAALGFDEIGRMTGSGFKHGRWLDTMLMQRELGDGNSTDPDPSTYPGTLFRRLKGWAPHFSTSFSDLLNTFSTCCRSWPRLRITPWVLTTE